MAPEYQSPELSRTLKASSSLDDVLVKISQTAQTGNLAAVLVHLNDTYFIEERSDSEIPGMARVAGLIKTIRKFVFDRLGEDRTLVLHSGGFSVSFGHEQTVYGATDG